VHPRYRHGVIDANAFAEWLVAKAAKRGAAVTDDNMRVAREAIELALARGGDDVHVACALAGAAGPVQIDEHMTHTAAETLFPKVAMSHPLPPMITREEKREAAPVLELELPRVERPDPAKTQRVAVVIAMIALVCACAIGLASYLAKDHDHHAGEHEKREMRH
jgi:hypothetical protein